MSLTSPCKVPRGKTRHGVSLASLCPDGLNKDEPDRPNYPKAQELAIEASRVFINEILQEVAGNTKAIKALMDIKTSISINPTTSTLQTGETTQFTVKSDDNTEAKVKWSASGGTIDSSGFYTAPTTQGTYTITATSVTDPSQKPSATVMVRPLGTGDIQATLRWSTVDDIDLELTDPTGARVSYSNPTVPSGGQLDVDANKDCDGNSATPVENIFWPPLGASQGEYVAAVNLFGSPE